MTGPAAGDARIDVHANTSALPGEIERGVREASVKAEAESRVGGGGVGDEFARAFDESLQRHGEGFARTIEDDINHHGINVHEFRIAEDAVDTVGRDVADGIMNALETAFSGNGGGGNILTNFVRDAVTNAFNTSSTSPLTTGVLVLAFGALGGLIGALVDAAQSLVAVLTTIPTLLGAIGIQGAILYLVFSGVSKQITAAFAATTPAEFKKAMDGLTASARDFVTTFVPAVKDFVNYMQRWAEQGFFEGLGNTIIPKVLALLKEFGPEIDIVAKALGGVASNIIGAFSQPGLFNFISDILPAIASWLNQFGPALGIFIEKVAEFADKMIPFTNVIGDKLIASLITLAEWLANIVDSSGFQAWLQQMLPVLSETADLFKQTFELILSFFANINSQNADRLIENLIDNLYVLTAFFASDAGKHFIDALIIGLEAVMTLFTMFVLGIGVLVSGLDYAGDGVKWLFGEIAKGIEGLINWFKGTADQFQHWGESFISFGKGIPGLLKNAIGDLTSLLFKAGQNLIQGLINGVKSMFGSAVGTVKDLVSDIAGYFPHSPAKVGPFSGGGSPYQRGSNMISDFTAGMMNEVPDLVGATSSVVNNITFGPGAVSVAYEGVNPSPDEARITGSAIGMGINSQLAARDAALSVRTL